MGFGVGCRYGDFLGNSEIVVERMLPINEPNGLCVFADIRFDLHAIAQQSVDGSIAVVNAFARVSGGLFKLVKTLPISDSS